MPSDPPRPPEHSPATGSWRPEAVGDGSRAAEGEPTTSVTGSGTPEPTPSTRRRAVVAPLPEPGDHIETFQLEEAIGAGGMGAVFRARDTRLDREVALKVLPPEQARDAEVVLRFYQEGRAAARLDHENIARVYAIGSDPNYHYIAFEYIEGMNVRRLVADRGPLPVEEAINYTLQVAGALVHAAGRGVVHRDIKPSNIIITPRGRAKLVDMGLARDFERNDGDDALTRSGMTLGTFDYISPEQARDPRDVDVRSDLYSLGCTLFHMLTGRPPFPDGNVVQKLIQHQEEPAPDVRSSNPALPAELAAVVTKLMAKDRDRRYQSPEQLSRDLLALAASLGLRSVSPEGLVWLGPDRPSRWERHLVWAVPTAALALVVVGLVWWGRPPERRAGLPTVAEVNAATPPPVVRPAAPAKPSVASKPVEPPTPGPRRITVRAGDDLSALLADAPSGSTLTLADDGPFDVRPTAAGSRRPRSRDLTIRAAPGTRPVLHAGATTLEGEAALIDAAGGRILIEGLEFDLQSDDRDEPVVAIRATDVDLTIRRCLFRHPDGAEGLGPFRALDLRATDRAEAESDRPAPTRVVASHFDGPGAAIRALGPAEIDLADSSFGPGGPAVVIRSQSDSPARLGARHVSILAGPDPVFRFEGEVVARVEDSVIAPAGEGWATLASVETPDELDWLGRGNLYGAIDPFLDVVGSRPSARRFDEWEDTPSGPRESGSTARDGPTWAAADPSSALSRRDPTSAFRLSTNDAAELPGIRLGPFGPIAAAPRADLLAQSPRVDRPPAPQPGPSPPSTPTATMPDPPLSADPVPAEAPPMPMVVEAAPMPMARDSTTNPAETSSPATEPPPSPPRPEAEPGPIRTEAQLLAALRRPSNRGESLKVAADAVIDTSGLDVPATGRWTIEAEAGATRPLLRFRPEPEAPSPAALVTVKGQGSLTLKGIDVLLPEDNAPAEGAWAAFGLEPGAELSLVRCTVTIEGAAPPSAILIARGGPDRPEPPAAVARLGQSLLRTGGDLADVAGGRPLDLEIEDSVVATLGSLVHGHGVARGRTTEPLKLGLRRVTARNAGGLVRLESTPDAPELPAAEVNARDSIVATAADDAPLFRVDTQEADPAARDRITWSGQGVAYHRIDVYRRDQSAEPGSMPTRFGQPDWEMAVGPREGGAVHRDVRFVDPWPSDRPLWLFRPSDARLAPDSPAASAGADLSLVPDAPE